MNNGCKVAIAVGLLMPLAMSVAGAEPRPLELRTRVLSEFDLVGGQRRFGRLTFLGGLEVSSPDGDFGSLSGLDFAPDGRLHAVTDRGHWVSARLDERDRVPLGLSGGKIGPLRDTDGRVAKRKVDADAEGLRIVPSNPTRALVSFEQIHTVRAYDLDAGPDGVPTRVALPGFVRGLRGNQGLEAIAVAPDDGPLRGAVVVLAERSLDNHRRHRGFVLGGPRAGAFALARSDGFDVTDAVFLPDGDLLVLERRFSYARGLAVRLRAVRGDTIRPGRTVDGEVLLTAASGFQIDNLEGLAVRVTDDGRTLVTLVSDDNHSMLQRTLLLQFALEPRRPPLPRLRPVVSR